MHFRRFEGLYFTNLLILLVRTELERVKGIEPSFYSNLCKTQQATLAFGLSLLEAGNSTQKGVPKPANDPRSGKRDLFPTFAPSE